MSNAEFKQMLLVLKKELEDRLEKTGKHLYRRDEPYSANFAEQAVEVESNQVIEQLDDEGKLELVEVKAALAKIELGSYGACDECHEEIGEKRLKAVPYARFCIDCVE